MNHTKSSTNLKSVFYWQIGKQRLIQMCFHAPLVSLGTTWVTKQSWSS